MPKVIVELGARTTGLQSGLDQLSGRLNTMFSTLRRFAPQLAAAFSFGAIAKFTKDTANAADAAKKLSEQAGLAVHEFSRWQYSAELANVKNEQLVKSSQKLAEWMSRIGETGADLNEELYRQADIIAGMTDSQERLTYARRVFGEEGLKLLPMLVQGSEALRRQHREAERLGVVFDAKTAAAAEKFNDNLTRLYQTLEGLRNNVIGPLLPILADLGDVVGSIFGEDGVFDMREVGLSISVVREFTKALGEGLTVAEAWKRSISDVVFGQIGGGGRQTPAGPQTVGQLDTLRFDLDANAAALRQRTGADYNVMLRERLRILGELQPLLEQEFEATRVNGELTVEYSKVMKELNGVMLEQQAIQEELASSSFLGRFQSGIRSMLIEVEMFGAAVADVMVNGVRRSIDTVADGIWAVVDGTRTWGEMFTDVARSIISDLIRIVLQWISGKLLMLAMEKIFGKAVQTSVAGQAATAAAAWSPAATAASIASYGAAAGVGLAAFTAAMAAGSAIGAGMGALSNVPMAFASGGMIPAGERVIRVNEAGQEGVVNAMGMRNIGADGLAAINQGLITAANLHESIPAGIAASLQTGPGGGSAPGAAPAGGGTLQLTLYLVDSRPTLNSEEGQAIVVDVVRNKKIEIGIPT